MADWRDAILREFTPQVAQLTLVADPDGLLVEEGVLKGIEERGFELIPFDDPIAFRFAYEARYRSVWDRGATTELVVVLRSEAGELEHLPYDLLQAGRKLAFSLAELFPNLSYPVVDALDRKSLDPLYEAQAGLADERLSDDRTKEFILRHVFRIAPEVVQEPHELLRMLLRRHHQGQQVPHILDDWLVRTLRRTGRFEEWPLEQLVSDRHAFLAFLQERWPLFLDHLAAGERRTAEAAEKYEFQYRGPARIPFDHDDVRVYVDNLFLEGDLDPVEHPATSRLAGTWAVAGLRSHGRDDTPQRLEKLLAGLEGAVPDQDAHHHDWLEFARRWGRLLALLHSEGASIPSDARNRTHALRDRLDASFDAWLADRYGTLANQPPVPPVMLHHVPRALARSLEAGEADRVALIVVDGLSIDQWAVVEQALPKAAKGVRLHESAVFAWVPTLTSVCRQACLVGRPPLYFPGALDRTDGEPTGWKRFWVDTGLDANSTGYVKGLRDPTDLEPVREKVDDPRLRALALVVDKVDRIMHGMQLGTAGMHGQVAQWGRGGMLEQLVDLLHERGFSVFLTADHGNIEAEGLGRPSEGAVAESRGERARVFRDTALRDRVAGSVPGAMKWPAFGLPDDFLPLLAPPRRAFVRENETTVAHGGACLEEVVVPFVRMERA